MVGAEQADILNFFYCFISDLIIPMALSLLIKLDSILLNLFKKKTRLKFFQSSSLIVTFFVFGSFF